MTSHKSNVILCYILYAIWKPNKTQKQQLFEHKFSTKDISVAIAWRICGGKNFIVKYSIGQFVWWEWHLHLSSGTKLHTMLMRSTAWTNSCYSFFLSLSPTLQNIVTCWTWIYVRDLLYYGYRSVHFKIVLFHPLNILIIVTM